MVPGARIQAAIDLLDAISSGNEPADRLIASYFRKRRYAGSSDRRTINDLVYNILRHNGRLNWWITRFKNQLELGSRTRMISELILEKKLSPHYIHSIFNGSKHCPLPLTDIEDSLAAALYGQSLNHEDMTIPVILEYPNWMDQYLKALWSKRLALEMSALNQPAPLDVRVNTLKITRDAVRLSLLENSIESKPTPMSPIGLRLTGKARLARTLAFKMGWIEVQDEGSQLIAFAQRCQTRHGCGGLMCWCWRKGTCAGGFHGDK
jgi:16S rRNA (cytosine967-C5)-methyltransferase